MTHHLNLNTWDLSWACSDKEQRVPIEVIRMNVLVQLVSLGCLISWRLYVSVMLRLVDFVCMYYDDFTSCSPCWYTVLFFSVHIWMSVLIGLFICHLLPELYCPCEVFFACRRRWRMKTHFSILDELTAKWIMAPIEVVWKHRWDVYRSTDGNLKI